MGTRIRPGLTKAVAEDGKDCIDASLIIPTQTSGHDVQKL